MLGPRVADRQLATAAPAADETGQQGIAVLGRSVIPARGDVVADHRADRLCPFPADITLVRVRDQRQPLTARLAAAARSRDGQIMPRHRASFTIGVGAAVNRVLDHPVDGGIGWPSPDHIAVAAPGRQIQPMLQEPEQSLSGAAKLGHLVEDEGDGLLDAAVGILLEPVAGLHEADGGRDDQLATPRLLVAGGQGSLPQQIELILVEAALQAQKQTVVALAWGIDGLLVDQDGVDDPAHLDELLPVAAVAGEARHLPRRDRADLAQADLGHHPVETGPRDAARRRTAKIVVDRLDAGPAERRQPVAHRILQGAALAVVQHLMGRGLPHIEDRLALQMVRTDLLMLHAAPPSAECARAPTAWSRIKRTISLVSVTRASSGNVCQCGVGTGSASLGRANKSSCCGVGRRRMGISRNRLLGSRCCARIPRFRCATANACRVVQQGRQSFQSRDRGNRGRPHLPASAGDPIEHPDRNLQSTIRGDTGQAAAKCRPDCPCRSPREREHVARPRDAKDREARVPRSRGRTVIELYNTVRPHSALGGRTPVEAHQGPGLKAAA